MRHLAVLIFLIGNNSFGSQASESNAVVQVEKVSVVSMGSSEAARCLEKFLVRHEALNSYSSRMKKVETLRTGEKSIQDIEIVARGEKYIQLKYMSRGSTGIRNNGMVVTFDGSDRLRVKLGSARNLGFFVNLPAKMFTGDTIAITDPAVVDDEIFTVNRAGFGYLARLLRRNWSAIRQGVMGNIKVAPGTCNIEYRAHLDRLVTIEQRERESIFEFEEKHGSIAYILYLLNSGKQERFSSFLNSSKRRMLRVPIDVASFDLSLDPVSHLPSKFVLFWEDIKIGEYLFTDTIFDESR